MPVAPPSPDAAEAGRPEVILVCTKWRGGAGDGESALRILLGALATRRRVVVASLEPAGSPTRGEDWDGIFALHHFPTSLGAPSRLVELALVEAGRPARSSSRPPEIPSRLLGLIEERPEATVVCAGPESLFLARVLGATGLARRLVVLPLGATEGLGPPGHIEVIGALSLLEKTALSAALPGARCELLRPPLRVPEDLSPPDLGGLGADLPMLVVLSGTSPSHEPLSLDHEYLRARLGKLVVAEVRPDRFLVTEPGRRHEVAWPAARMDLWRLMARADALLDLRPQGPFGRETVESLLLATPVVVPRGSAAASHALESAGGLSYADPPQMFARLSELFGDAAARREMGENGTSWARSRYGTGKDGDESLADLLLGSGW